MAKVGAGPAEGLVVAGGVTVVEEKVIARVVKDVGPEWADQNALMDRADPEVRMAADAVAWARAARGQMDRVRIARDPAEARADRDNADWDEVGGDKTLNNKTPIA